MTRTTRRPQFWRRRPSGGGRRSHRLKSQRTEADFMSRSEQKVVQYLNEAHATEVALVRVLQSQIAMTPRGSYRSGLEKHLAETRDHANRIQRRLGQLDHGGNPVMAAVGVGESIVFPAVALV